MVRPNVTQSNEVLTLIASHLEQMPDEAKSRVQQGLQEVAKGRGVLVLSPKSSKAMVAGVYSVTVTGQAIQVRPLNDLSPAMEVGRISESCRRDQTMIQTLVRGIGGSLVGLLLASNPVTSLIGVPLTLVVFISTMDEYWSRAIKDREVVYCFAIAKGGKEFHFIFNETYGEETGLDMLYRQNPRKR